MSRRKYPVSVTVRMTHEMHANLRRLAAGDRKVARLMREMIRAQLDERAEIAGSRRHFSARFQERIDRLETRLEAYLALLAMLVTEFEELMIQADGIADTSTNRPPYPALFRGGTGEALRYLDDVRLAAEEIAERLEDEQDPFVDLTLDVTPDDEEWEEEGVEDEP